MRQLPFASRGPRARRRPGVLAAAIVVLSLAAAAGVLPAAAQNVMRIAAVVNDRVISALDVVNRLEFVLFSTGLEDTAENRRRLAAEVLRNLVDEELKLQEAEKLNVTVSRQEIEQDFAQLARQNELTGPELAALLQRNGLERATLDRQIEARVAWTKTVGRRARREVQVSEEEIDAELAEVVARRGRPQVRLAEIVLPVDDPDQDEQTRQNALRLIEQMRQGASFSALARAFSQSSSASTGGDLGWLTADQLDTELAAEIEGLDAGEVAGPVRLFSGYHILLVIDRRKPESAGDSITLSQVVLPLASNASAADVESAQALGEQIRQVVSSCGDLAETAGAVGGSRSRSLGTVNLSDLPPEFRAAVAPLAPGQLTEPLRSTEGDIVILMVCDRDGAANADLPSRIELRNHLQGERMELLARRYLRDLRRAAVVDVRG